MPRMISWQMPLSLALWAPTGVTEILQELSGWDRSGAKNWEVDQENCIHSSQFSELYSPLRTALSLTKSKNLAYFDRLCTFVSSKCCNISLNFLHSTKTRKAISPKFSNMAFTWSLMLSRMVKKTLAFFHLWLALCVLWLSGQALCICAQISHENCQTPVFYILEH